LGLKVNLWKSELVAIGEVLHKENLTNILSRSISSLNLKYLGLPLGALFEKLFGMRVVEKMEKMVG
jgi:hypothetical protein